MCSVRELEDPWIISAKASPQRMLGDSVPPSLREDEFEYRQGNIFTIKVGSRITHAATKACGSCYEHCGLTHTRTHVLLNAGEYLRSSQQLV